MNRALSLAEKALSVGEVPVACVFIYRDRILAEAHNQTNLTRNATRHCEMVCLESIEENYGLEVLKETILYVTVEPCVMCAAALRLAGLFKVIFGCHNPKFGGMGSAYTLQSEDFCSTPVIEVEAGVQKDHAILLLRKFYLSENPKAPNPKDKSRRSLKTQDLCL